MKLLLDTHIWLWSQLEPERLSPKVMEALDDPGAEIYLSPLTLLEARRLAELGRVDLGPDTGDWVQRALDAAPVREALVSFDVAQAAAALPRPPRDPVDRLLIGTALALHLTLVTADEEILSTADCQLLSNRA